MRRCPDCLRDYHDDSLLYCLDDGRRLLEGPAGPDRPRISARGLDQYVNRQFEPEPQTAILHETAPPSEPATRMQIHTTENPFAPAAARGPAPSGFDKRLILAPLLGVVLILGGFLGYRSLSASAGPIESIAVMPFVNDTGNPDVEYLSDGMTESLISSLAKLPNVNVKPRSSVFRYKGKSVDPPSVGTELGVQAILNGRLTNRGGDIALYVELTDAALNKIVWSGSYIRRQADLVSLQTAMARDISTKIKTKLSAPDEERVTKAYTVNPDAYELFLKGNYHRSKYNEEGVKKGIEYYTQAIEIDPNYALAWYEMAVAYSTAAEWYMPSSEASPLSRAALAKALELDDTLAEAHYFKGRTAFWREWDWETAEQEFHRAAELDPSSYPTYGLYLSAMGRHEEAIGAQEARQKVLPLDLQTNNDLGSVYRYAGRFEQAIEQDKKTLEIDQNYWAAYRNLGLTYERKKQYAEAIAALEKARSLDPNPTILGWLGYVLATAGKNAEARKVLEELKEVSKRRQVSYYSMAIIHAGLGEKDEAFALLDRAYDARSYFMSLLKVDTTLDNLRTDPRFARLLSRMNLAD